MTGENAKRILITVIIYLSEERQEKQQHSAGTALYFRIAKQAWLAAEIWVRLG